MGTGIRRSNENLHKSLRTPANIRINLISPTSLNIPAADAMGLHLLFLFNCFQKIYAKILHVYVSKKTEFNVEFKVTYFASV